LRKEGFSRVHRQRKGDSLRLPDGLREKSSKVLAQRKECTKDTVISSYKLRRKGSKFPGGREKVH
jgi:hypothetical protein